MQRYTYTFCESTYNKIHVRSINLYRYIYTHVQCVYIYICVTTDKHILSDLNLSSMFHTLVFWQNATGTISSHGVLDCQISCAALAESKIACSYSEELFPFDVIFFCPILPFKDVCFLHKAFQILFWPAKGIDHCSHFPALLGQCRCFIYSLACIYIYM